MSARAQRNDRSTAHDSQWLEFPDPVEISPASVWDSDYEDEITVQNSRVATEQPQQLTAETDDEPDAGENRPSAPMLDEPQVLPNEASFATVELYPEVTPSEYEELTTSTIAETSETEAYPRARMLDESQVLPNEASFATVKLYQEVTPSWHEELTTSTTTEPGETGSYRRTRTLDVSHVLPGEVSFATVMLNQETIRHYSPLREFFAKSGLNWPRLMVEALLLVLVLAVLTMVAFQVAREGAFSSNSSVSNSADTSPPQTETTVIQPELSAPGATVSAAVSNQPSQQDDQAASTPENAEKLEAAVELEPDNSSDSLESEGSRIAAADETRLKIRKNSQQEGKSKTRNSVSVVESSKPRLATQQPRPRAKESEAGNRPTPTERTTVTSPRPQTVEPRRESSTVSTTATSVPPKAVTTSAPVTGGGQRPRTVTRKSDP